MREIKRDCFAFRYNGRVATCDACTNLNCHKCPFYKPADSVDLYETKYMGKPLYGYIDRKGAALSRLLALRDEIDTQIMDLQNER